GAGGLLSNITVQSGAALLISGGISTGGENYGGSLTLNGNGATAGQNGALVSGGGNNLFAGALILGSSATISADAGELTLSGSSAVTGTGDLTLTGGGVGTLYDSLEHTGGLNVTGGGTWGLLGAGGTFTGATNITGTLLYIYGGALGATSGTTLAGAELILLNGSQNLGNLSIAANTRNIVRASGSTTLSMGSTINRGVGGTVTFDILEGATVTTSATGSGTNNILGYALVSETTGATTVTGMGRINGSGNIVRFDSTTAATLTATSNSSGTDYTTLGNAGTLIWTDGGALTNRSVNSLTIDATGNSGQITDMGNTANVLTLSSGALQFVGSENGTLTGGRVGAADSELFIHQFGTGTFTIGSLLGTGSSSLVKDGDGTLILAPVAIVDATTAAGSAVVTVTSTAGLYAGQTITGNANIPAGTTILSVDSPTQITLSRATGVLAGTVATTFPSATNTYTGATLINAGVLRAGSANAFSASSEVTLANVAGAALDINGFNQTIKSLAGGGATGGDVLLSGGATLTIGGPNVIGNINYSNIHTSFGGLISGDGNLTFTGGGVIALTNNNNTYTGQTNVNAGTLVISNMGQLGATALVAVNGIASLSGLPGGMLIVQGGSAGLNFDRNLSLSGRSNNAVGLSLLNIGNNTYSGLISAGHNTEARFGSSFGTMTLAGTTTLHLGAGNAFFLVGGPGNLVIDALVSGGNSAATGLYKSTTSGINNTMVLTNNNNNFVSDVRVDSGTIRVSHGGQLGLGRSGSAMRGTGGSFEIRTDDPGSFTSRNVSGTDTGVTMLLDRAAGGTGLGTQTVSVAGVPGYVGASGHIVFNEMFIGTGGGRTLTFSGRNGYGASWNGGLDGLLTTATNGAPSVTNSSNGVVFMDGSVQVSSDGTSRIFTINGNGETVMTGFIRQGGGAGLTTFNKAGNGTLVMTGSLVATPLNVAAGPASSFTGSTNVQAGTLLLSGANATIGNTKNGILNGVAGGALQVGNGGTFAAFDYRGPGETTAKTFNLIGTTGAGIILANQTGATGLVFNTSAIGAGGIGAKNFYLGGSSLTTTINEIAGVINNSSSGATSLVKFGTNTWLYAPAASTYAAGAAPTWVSGGAANTNTFVVSSVANIGIGSTVTGTNIPAGSVVTAINGTTVTISNNITTALAAGTFTFRANANF
ncbi:MAG: hypothetical protein B7Z47_03990, partial [Chthoniobacter sp. 12-60-6]